MSPAASLAATPTELLLLRERMPLAMAPGWPADGMADPQQASARLAREFSPHRLQLIGPSGDFCMRLCTGRVGSLAISSLSFSSEVELAQRAARTFYLVSTQLSGRSEVAAAGRRCDQGGAGLVMVDSATRDVVKRFSADSERLHVRLECDAVSAFCAQLLGQSLTRPLEFEPVMAEGSSAQRRWFVVVQLLLDHACMPLPAVLAPRVHRQLEELAMLTLLTEHRHSYSERLAAPVPALAPRHVRLAEEFMRAHIAQALTLADIAAAARVSIRTLSAGFQAWRGSSPMRVPRELRLDAAREWLQRGEVSVADAALCCGFGHLGRFAAEYQRRFGEPPSQTRRRG